MPLFSHLYLKSMTAEQLVRLADHRHQCPQVGKRLVGTRPKSTTAEAGWQQFVQAFGTDENDDSTSFDGTIPQALDDDEWRTDPERSLRLRKGKRCCYDVASRKRQSGRKGQNVSTWRRCRENRPRRKEIQTANRIMKNRAKSPLEAFQDLYWALLNSNEFIMNH